MQHGARGAARSRTGATRAAARPATGTAWRTTSRARAHPTRAKRGERAFVRDHVNRERGHPAMRSPSSARSRAPARAGQFPIHLRNTVSPSARGRSAPARPGGTPRASISPARAIAADHFAGVLHQETGPPVLHGLGQRPVRERDHRRAGGRPPPSRRASWFPVRGSGPARSAPPRAAAACASGRRVRGSGGGGRAGAARTRARSTS